MSERLSNYFSLFVLCICNMASPVNAQYADRDFIRYSVKDGLTDNNVVCLEQDAQGYMWIGTDAGLNRFDGTTFKPFYQGTPPINLPSGSMWRLKRFGKNELGILSKAGFLLLNTSDYSVRQFRIRDSTAISVYLNASWDAVSLPGNGFAVSTAMGFYVYNANGEVVFRYDGYSAADIGKKRILYGRDVFSLPRKKYLVYANEAGGAVYDAESKKYRELDPNDKEWSVFLHGKEQPGEGWIVKYQLSETKYIFIPNRVGKIIYYDYATRKKIESTLPAQMSDSLNWESRILQLDDSTMAVNSRTNGFYLLKLDRLNGRITCDGKKFLRNYKILCLYRDKDKRLWAGTTEGLLKQELQPPIITSYHYQPAGGEKFTGGFVTTFRHKDILYAARFSFSKGLVLINPVTMELLKEIEFYGNKSEWNEIRSIEMYHPDTLWIGSNGGLLWFDTKSHRYGKVLDEAKYPWATRFFPVLAPAHKDGTTWICSILDAKLVRYDIAKRSFTLFTPTSKPALPFEKVKTVVYDSYGDVWIAGHSLTRWNNRLQDFDTLITVYGGTNKYNDDIVSIRADDNGSLWLHNMYNGLLEYKIREKRFVAYSMKDGLPSDVLQSLSPVINNRLWIAGHSELSLFDIKTKQFTVFDQNDGLPEHKPTGRRMYYDSASGYVYLCSNEHIARFPFHPPRIRDNSSGLLLEEISIGNKRTVYRPGDELIIKHRENSLVLHCTVIDYEKTNYQFAYRLSTSDPWTPLGHQRLINLANLPRGEYTMQIKATGKPGIEKLKTFSFTITPPLWKTWWFIALAAATFISGIYYMYRRRVQTIRQKANVDRMLSQTEMKALQAQMNPHFIFNSLNSIREMILNNENKEASHYLSKFAYLIRITLDQSSQSMVSLRNTVEYLQRYMEMENIRNSLFTYEVNVDETLEPDETFVPPMLIQPFIENALWHGISARDKTIHVKINFRKVNNTLVCTIDDNGIGIQQSQKNRQDHPGMHKPHGISNIQDRMKLLNEKYGIHGRISIEDKKNIGSNGTTGTLVTLTLPLETEDHEQNNNHTGR